MKWRVFFFFFKVLWWLYNEYLMQSMDLVFLDGSNRQKIEKNKIKLSGWTEFYVRLKKRRDLVFNTYLHRQPPMVLPSPCVWKWCIITKNARYIEIINLLHILIIILFFLLTHFVGVGVEPIMVYLSSVEFVSSTLENWVSVHMLYSSSSHQLPTWSIKWISLPWWGDQETMGPAQIQLNPPDNPTSYIQTIWWAQCAVPHSTKFIKRGLTLVHFLLGWWGSKFKP